VTLDKGKRKAPAQQDPSQPDPAAIRRRRLGVLLKRLRIQAGMLRSTLGLKVGLANAEIMRLEEGRFILTAARWQLLTAALPALQGEVERHGIKLDLADPDEGGQP
jgi:hypothetical protein